MLHPPQPSVSFYCHRAGNFLVRALFIQLFLIIKNSVFDTDCFSTEIPLLPLDHGLFWILLGLLIGFVSRALNHRVCWLPPLLLLIAAAVPFFPSSGSYYLRKSSVFELVSAVSLLFPLPSLLYVPFRTVQQVRIVLPQVIILGLLRPLPFMFRRHSPASILPAL